MPILIDFNQFILAAIFNSLRDGFSTTDVVNENIVRGLFLNQIRANRKKFHAEYGELVICCDSKFTWRKDLFPYYKCRRELNKAESKLDWTKLHNAMQKIKTEVFENFPYKTIQIDKCEADDIIGVICNEYGDEFLAGEEKFLILSRDKDYKQLLKYVNVKQYDQQDKKYLHVDDAELFLKEMIFKGDGGDDIPNVLSADNVFAAKIRQNPMTEKRLTLLMNGDISDEVKINMERNRNLIDLSKVPEIYKTKILEAYQIPCPNKRGKLHKYFIDNRLAAMLPDIGDF